MRLDFMVPILNDLLLSLRAPLCDLHHWGHHGSSPDPEGEALVGVCMATMAILVAGTFFLACFGGPLILVLTRKARHLFWAIPAVNVLFYTVAVFVRPYPGGVRATFQMPGLFYTILELTFLILLSLATATIVAVVYWIIRLARMARTVPAYFKQQATKPRK
jgi:hypothetical protein